MSAKSKPNKPTEVKMNIRCPHCEKRLFIILTRDNLELLRKGFRSKISQAQRYWGRVRFKIGKEPERK